MTKTKTQKLDKKEQAANALQALFETAQKDLKLSYHDMSFALLTALMQRSMKKYPNSCPLFRYELIHMGEVLEELGAAVTDLDAGEVEELAALLLN